MTSGSPIEAMSHSEQNDKMSPNSNEAQQPTVVEPYVGQEFESEAAALEFYCAYAARMGFATRIRDHNRSQRDGSTISRTLVCNKEGYRKPNSRHEMTHMGPRRRPRATTRVGCRARAMFRRTKIGKWVIRTLIKEHTHPLTVIQSPKARIFQIQNDDRRVHELTRELMMERKRSASLKEFINLLFNHIEEHTQGLSEKIQHIVEKVNKIESEAKDRQNLR